MLSCRMMSTRAASCRTCTSSSKDGYTLDDVRDKINACLPERYMRPVEIFTVPERPFFHFKTNRIGLSKEIIAKRNQQKEKAKRNSFADGCIA